MALRSLATFALCLVIAAVVSAQTPQRTDRAPTGWHMAGSNPAGYRAGTDRAEMHSALPSAYLAAVQPSATGFGTLMQSINATNYQGKRIRLRGSVKSQEVSDWAGLWMRVDRGQSVAAFDNMQDRSIKGTLPWNSYDVVLDVPSDATSISFGILLTGAGEIWLNDVTFEVVGSDTQTTGQGMIRPTLPAAPVNLGFSE